MTEMRSSQPAGVGRLQPHRKPSLLNAGDVDEVADKSPNPRAQPLNPACRLDVVPARLVRGRALHDDSGAHRDAAQQRPHVMADHPHQRVPRRHGGISARAFDEQLMVRQLALKTQQLAQRPLPFCSFIGEHLAGGAALLSNHRILIGSLFLHRMPLPGRRTFPLEFDICPFASVRQELAGAVPGALEDFLRLHIDGLLPTGKLVVGFRAFAVEALIRLFPLRVAPMGWLRHDEEFSPAFTPRQLYRRRAAWRGCPAGVPFLSHMIA